MTKVFLRKGKVFSSTAKSQMLKAKCQYLFLRTKFYKIRTKKNISFFNFILLQRNLKSVKNERKNRKESC